MMDLLPDYTDFNSNIYGEVETKTPKSKKEWWYPLVWLAMLVVIIMAWVK